MLSVMMSHCMEYFVAPHSGPDPLMFLAPFGFFFLNIGMIHVAAGM